MAEPLLLASSARHDSQILEQQHAHAELVGQINSIKELNEKRRVEAEGIKVRECRQSYLQGEPRYKQGHTHAHHFGHQEPCTETQPDTADLRSSAQHRNAVCSCDGMQ